MWKSQHAKMRHLINYLFFTLFLFTSNIFSQSGIVRGTIIDSDFQDPVPFANILVKETGTGTTSDFDGNYEIILEEGPHSTVGIM